MPTDCSKFFKRTFEAYFLMKIYEIWMRDYRNENTSNDIFKFSVCVIELELQPIGFF